MKRAGGQGSVIAEVGEGFERIRKRERERRQRGGQIKELVSQHGPLSITL